MQLTDFYIVEEIHTNMARLSHSGHILLSNCNTLVKSRFTFVSPNF